MMSDAELVRACAERIMGWHFGRGRGMNAWLTEDGEEARGVGYWNPLESDFDSAEVLDKMAADGWDWQLLWYRTLQLHCCHFHHLEIRDVCHTAYEADRRRCVVLAALRAKGVEVGDA